MQGQFVIPIERYDGVKVNMEIKQKNVNGKKRKVKTWSVQEDNQLIQLHEQYPKKWAVIASMMNDRNQNQCLHRYRRLSQLGAHRKIWSPQEDQTIKKLMKKVGKNWKILSEMLGSKTGKQIRERFINKLDPKIKKEEWTDEEDRKIIELYSEIGRKWSEISKHLPGRPQNKIKNRFYSYIQKNYDIKYKIISKGQTEEIEEEVKQPKKQAREFKEITSNFTNVQQNHQQSDVKIEERQLYYYPSINQIDIDLRMEDYENKHSKSYIQSMIKLEEDWGKYKNFDDFGVQNEDIQDMNHDLFFLNH